MIPLSYVDGIQIDITNICHLECLYCSRYIAHLRKDQRDSMTLAQVEKALQTLVAWTEAPVSRVRKVPHWIGIIGGEPTLHPQFVEICHLIKKYFPVRAQVGQWGAVGLWSTGTTPQYWKHKKLIDDTFGFLILNPHDKNQEEQCKHQPISVAIEEAVPDEKMRHFLIKNCWVQRQWCPTINWNGAYFCEVAANLDIILHEGKRAWPVEEGWWQRIPGQDGLYDQARDLCNKCGMAAPMERDLIGADTTKFSPGLLKLFRDKEMRAVKPEQVTLVDRKISNEEIVSRLKSWMPANYHGDFFPDEVNQLDPFEWLGIHPDEHANAIRVAQGLPEVPSIGLTAPVTGSEPQGPQKLETGEW
jgi:hypothetical protein